MVHSEKQYKENETSESLFVFLSFLSGIFIH